MVGCVRGGDTWWGILERGTPYELNRSDLPQSRSRYYIGFEEVGMFVAKNLRKVSKRCSLSSAANTFLVPMKIFAGTFGRAEILEWRFI
jgi:hypothetical protein